MAENFRPLQPCCMLNPVPAVMLSCRRSMDEKPNLITVAWAGTVCSDPPMVSVSIQPKRFSHDIIRDSGEFVIELVDAAHCREMDYCGVRSGRDVDKFAQCGFTPIPAAGMTLAPAVAECPAYLSCKVRQIITLGSHDLFIAEVVGVEVREDMFSSDGSMHLEKGGLVCYNHGLYQRTGEVLGFFGYSLARPEVLEKRMAPYREA